MKLFITIYKHVINYKKIFFFFLLPPTPPAPLWGGFPFSSHLPSFWRVPSSSSCFSSFVGGGVSSLSTYLPSVLTSTVICICPSQLQILKYFRYLVLLLFSSIYFGKTMHLLWYCVRWKIVHYMLWIFITIDVQLTSLMPVKLHSLL